MLWLLKNLGRRCGLVEHELGIPHSDAIGGRGVRRSFGFGRAQAAFASVTFLVAASPAGYRTSVTHASAATAVVTPSPNQTPYIPVQIPAAKHMVYVLATDVRPDYDSTRDKMIAGFTETMQSRTLKDDTWALVPMPEWTLANFVDACGHTNDPTYSIEGAVILRVYAVSYWITHRTFQEAHTSAIDADAIYAKCQPNENPKVVYTWHDAVQYEDGTIGITNVAALTLLLPLAALYQSFVPAKGQITVTTKPFLQPSPLPSGSQITTVTSSYDPQAAEGTGSLATSLLASGLTYTQAVLNTPPPINDRATWNAVNKLSAQIAADTRCPRSSLAARRATETALPGASVAPFCPTPSQ
jgi:hypothetical protein